MENTNEPIYTFAEVRNGKIVSINKHWVPLEQFAKFFDASSLFIDITDVIINGEAPVIGDSVVTDANGYSVIHKQQVYSPAQYRAYVTEVMKLTRDQKELEPISIEVNGSNYMFDADKDAITRIAKARQLIEDGAVESIIWTTFDNDHVELHLEDFKKLNAAQSVHSSQLHARYNEIKTYIYSLKDEELDILNDFTWDSYIGG